MPDTIPPSPPSSRFITLQGYSDFVGKLFKHTGTPEANLMHAAIGISGEAGEILDAVKKTWVYNKPLDCVNLIEELGDLWFYMTWMVDFLGISYQDILEANVAKLEKRYPNGYTDAAAQLRLDKQA